MTKKILLADDSITIRKVVGIIFATEDYQLSMADNGDDALSMAQSEVPDLIIADITMPGKDGFELCRAIKGSPHFAGRTAVMLLPGAFDHFDEIKAQDVCADGWLTKPFESQALLDKVAQILEAEPLVMAGVDIEEDEASAVFAEESSFSVEAVADSSVIGESETEEAEDIWESVTFDDDLGDNSLVSVAATDSFADDVFASDQESDEFIPDFSDEGSLADDLGSIGSHEFSDEGKAEGEIYSFESEESGAGNVDFSAFDEDKNSADITSPAEFTLASDDEELSSNDSLELVQDEMVDQPLELMSEEIEDEPLELVQDDAGQVDEPLDLVQAEMVDQSLELMSGEIGDEPLDLVQDVASQVEEPLDLVQDEVSQVEEPLELMQDEALDVGEPLDLLESDTDDSPHESEMFAPEPLLEMDQNFVGVSVPDDEDVFDLSEDDIVEEAAESVSSEADTVDDFVIYEDPESDQDAADRDILEQSADTEMVSDDFVDDQLSVADQLEDEFATATDMLADGPLDLDEVEEEAYVEPVSDHDFAVIDSVVAAETEDFEPVADVQSHDAVAPAVASVAAAARVEEQLRALSEEELRDVVGRVAGPLIENIAREMVENIVWEVVPDLAEVMIREEITKITGESE